MRSTAQGTEFIIEPRRDGFGLYYVDGKRVSGKAEYAPSKAQAIADILNWVRRY